MADQRTVLIVGGGQAGFQAAASLRERGFDGRVMLVGDEPERPYLRPPLSKAYLTGATAESALSIRPETFYATNHIEVLTGQRATAIDRVARRVSFAAHSDIAYDHLILALGTRNRQLRIPGADSDGVVYLRTLGEARAVHQRLATTRRLVVIGAGFIGLEVAATAAKLGIETHVLDVMPRILARASSHNVSEYLAGRHAEWGSVIVLNTGVEQIVAEGGKVTGVVTSGGKTLPADMVLVGIGVEPNVELAAVAGLPVANGIVVDQHLTTPDPNISAIGDCAVYPSRFAQGVVRLESVQNAVDHARCVAARLTGTALPYDSVPWFWSDQGPIKLQIVGLATGYDRTVLRGDPASGQFSIFCFRGDQLLAIESINRPADHMAGRRMLASGLLPTAEQAGDPGFDLKTFASTPKAAVAGA